MLKVSKQLIKMDQNGPKAPDDEQTKKIIETLAKNVAKHGQILEKKFKEKRGNNSTVSFLDEGKDFNDYYKHRVNIFSKF